MRKSHGSNEIMKRKAKVFSASLSSSFLNFSVRLCHSIDSLPYRTCYLWTLVLKTRKFHGAQSILIWYDSNYNLINILLTGWFHKNGNSTRHECSQSLSKEQLQEFAFVSIFVIFFEQHQLEKKNAKCVCFGIIFWWKEKYIKESKINSINSSLL